ncbi:MAG: hypothetical protein U9N56_00325 [Actinomycetota bacterium]|nr:hypothetical protein [Actinomycetota bacterium]
MQRRLCLPNTGTDTSTAVLTSTTRPGDPAYDGSPLPFTGALDKVVITPKENTVARPAASKEIID